MRATLSRKIRILARCAVVLFTFAMPFAIVRAQSPLTIYQINVQQGDCTLIVGPDGTTFLIDAGDIGKGTREVVPYLQSIGMQPADGLDFMLATHRDSDHLGGLDEVIQAGYDVHNNVWDNGSDKSNTQITQFLSAAQGTQAGAVEAMPLGHVVQLGSGATATCVAVGGVVLSHGTVTGATGENDMSVAILVRFGDFEYITAGDLGGGDSDRSCTDRSTSQANVETPLAISLMPGEGVGLLTADGIEVLGVNHHGSESSTNSDYMNLLTPSVAIINTGPGQGGNFHHPRIDVVESVLMAQAECISAPPALVLQTEEGNTAGTNTSTEGFCVGDVVIETTGTGTFHVSATGSVSQGPDERSAAGIDGGKSFPLDGSGSSSAVSIHKPPGEATPSACVGCSDPCANPEKLPRPELSIPTPHPALGKQSGHHHWSAFAVEFHLHTGVKLDPQGLFLLSPIRSLHFCCSNIDFSLYSSAI